MTGRDVITFNFNQTILRFLMLTAELSIEVGHPK